MRKRASASSVVAPLVVLVDALLEHRAEHIPDLAVGLGVAVGELFQIAQHAAGDAFLDGGEDRALLDHLARQAERQVGGIDQPAHEAQIVRQDFGVVGDEDALDVELHPALAVAVVEIERPRARHEGQRGELVAALGAEMHGQRRLVELCRKLR